MCRLPPAIATTTATLSNVALLTNTYYSMTMRNFPQGDIRTLSTANKQGGMEVYFGKTTHRPKETL